MYWGAITVDAKNYPFSGAAYISHENLLNSLEQMVELTKSLKAQNCSVQFYSTDFTPAAAISQNSCDARQKLLCMGLFSKNVSGRP
jgi:hypothetical protein